MKNLTVDHDIMSRLHAGENYAEVDRLASERCSLKPTNRTIKMIFITDDGHVEVCFNRTKQKNYCLGLATTTWPP